MQIARTLPWRPAATSKRLVLVAVEVVSVDDGPLMPWRPAATSKRLVLVAVEVVSVDDGPLICVLMKFV